jgi:hypothetical protein
MTHTVLPPTPPASTARRIGLLFAIVAGSGLVALTLLIALGWWGLSQLSGSAAGGTVKAFSGSTARAYAAQLAEVELPGSFEVIKREHGGTYFAAGNGPYASISYRTSESLNSAVAQVQQAMEQAGYTVRPSSDDNPFFKDVTRLDGIATGRDIEALIGVGEVYDQPFGYIAPVPGSTGVLLVVEDHGRSR